MQRYALGPVLAGNVEKSQKEQAYYFKHAVMDIYRLLVQFRLLNSRKALVFFLFKQQIYYYTPESLWFSQTYMPLSK